MSGGGSGKTQTVGRRYYLGQHLGLCQAPVDDLQEIRVGDKTVWAGKVSTGRISVNQPNILGGDQAEGGIAGDIDVLNGNPSQAYNDYLSQFYASLTTFRGAFTLVLRKMYVGANNYYLKNWKFKISRHTCPWRSDLAKLPNGMNPVHILYCMWVEDMQRSENFLDLDNFAAVAQQLKAENFGLNFFWNREGTFEDFSTIVKRHIAAEIRNNPINNKMQLKLIRKDYNPPAVMHLTEDDILDFNELKNPAVSDRTNSVTVTYRNVDNDSAEAITVHSLQLDGYEINTSVDLSGISDGALAQSCASRELLTLSRPLRSATITVTRIAEGVRPADVIAITYPLYRLKGVLMRVTEVTLSPLEDCTVQLSLIEDVFGENAPLNAPSPESEWQPLPAIPAAIVDRKLMEVPYYFLSLRLGDEAAQALPPDCGYVMTVASPKDYAFNFISNFNFGSAYQSYGYADFCAFGVISEAHDLDDDLVNLSLQKNMDRMQTGHIGVLSSGELVQVTAKTATTLTLKRGILDTPPKPIVKDDKIFIFSGGYYSAPEAELVRNQTAKCKLRPQSGNGLLPIESAPEDTLVLTGRQYRPYPPAKVRINGVKYPQTVNDSVVVTWVGRNRLTQTTSTILSQDDSGVVVEAGVEFVLKLYKGQTLIETLTVPSFTATFNAALLTSGEIYTLHLYSKRAAIANTDSLPHLISFEFKKAEYEGLR